MNQNDSFLRKRYIESTSCRGHQKSRIHCQKICGTLELKKMKGGIPICRLTSQWSGRFRAARFSAAHRRVRLLQIIGADSAYLKTARFKLLPRIRLVQKRLNGSLTYVTSSLRQSSNKMLHGGSSGQGEINTHSSIVGISDGRLWKKLSRHLRAIK